MNNVVRSLFGLCVSDEEKSFLSLIVTTKKLFLNTDGEAK